MASNKIDNLSELVNVSLDKLKKALTKKQFEIKQAIDDASTVKTIGNANHLLKVYQLCIESKQTRLIELTLFDLKNLVEQNYFQGELEYQSKRVIDYLLDLVLSVKEEKEETIQIYMIRALQTLMTSRMHHIHGEAVTRIFALLINIYSVTKVVTIANASKEACQRIVNAYYIRLEEFGMLNEEEFGNAQLKSCLIGERYRMKAQVNAEEFMRKLMLSLVDETQLYSERMNIYNKALEEQQEKKEIDLNNIIPPPLRIVSITEGKVFPQVSVLNERQIKNGKFGWCVVCRNAAQSYCKDTKVPVCSKECKLIHLNQMLTYTQVFIQGEHSAEYVKDGYEILDMLCQLSQREPQSQQLQPMVIKCKTLSLELIYEALASGDVVLQNKKEIIQILRDSLLDCLLKNSLSSEKSLLILTLNIFVQLIWKFRSEMKKEMEAIIENVYFKFLDSSNSQFDHKQYTLKVFNKILVKPQVVLELFVNYDCSVGQNNLFRKIMDSQCRIIQGRYSKPEFQASISLQQEQYLKSLCLDNFTQFIRSLKQYCDDQDNLQTIQHNQDVIDDFEEQTPIPIDSSLGKQRQMKQELNKAVQKFNFKLEHCIKHLIACQYMTTRDPKLFAQFLWENRDVNKDKLGELFGGAAEFNQQVFSIYVDLMNFQQQNIDEALRYLLEYFTLPMESQEIDRVMQKFASKYVNDNPNLFNSATAAYTLSYLLMMLQTDLHNPQNVDKMTIPQFINLARGINDGADLPQEELTGLYERILKVPLALHAKEQARKALEMANQVDQRKRHALLAKEAEQSMKKWFKDHQNQDAYFFVTSMEHVKFLLEQTWSSVFASFSLILEHSEDPQQIQSCFEAIGLCVKLMGRFDLDDERDTFLFFLQKYCPSIPQNYKQIIGMQTVLQIGQNAGLYLRKSWKVILQLVSRLETLHSVIKKVRVEISPKEQHSLEDIQNIEKLFQVIEYSAIDKLFNNSIQLDSDSILDFIHALCDLSKEEIQKGKTFLLSKVVEVADFNMGRIKIIWSKMWEIMREHFLEVGCNKNVDLAIYAIDQLKQLSCKFLQQQELANYHFQKEFLIPFEQIFIHSQQNQQYKPQLREYILSCMSMITNVCFSSLKSGWKLIMSIVNSALQEEHQVLSKLCVQITDKIMDGPFDNISEIYMELIQALIKLTKNKDLSIVLKSIDQIDILINYIANDKKKGNEKFLDQIWIPVLSSLSILYSDERCEVQTASVTTLFQLLQNHGAQQNAEFWKMILRGVIRPLFDEIQFTKLAKQKNKQNEQIISSCKMTFDKFTQLVIEQITQMQQCINDLIEIYLQLVLQTQDNISILCLESLKSIVSAVGNQFTQENWDMLIDSLNHILTQCSPRELLEAFNLDEDFQKPLSKLMSEEIKHKKFSFKVNGLECSYKAAIQEKCLEIFGLPIIFKGDILKILNIEYQKCKAYNTHLYMRYFLQKQCDTLLPSFLNAEFLTCKIIIQLLQGNDLLAFVQQLVERCIDAQINHEIEFQLKDDINSQLAHLRKQESILEINQCQTLLMSVLQDLQITEQNKKTISKWLIGLLKNNSLENKQFFQILIQLLERVIELN